MQSDGSYRIYAGAKSQGGRSMLQGAEIWAVQAQDTGLPMINDHIYEGRFTPRMGGKRISKNVYAKTREECEEKLAVLIVEMKAEIKAEKERRKQTASA